MPMLPPPLFLDQPALIRAASHGVAQSVHPMSAPQANPVGPDLLVKKHLSNARGPDSPSQNLPGLSGQKPAVASHDLGPTQFQTKP